MNSKLERPTSELQTVDFSEEPRVDYTSNTVASTASILIDIEPGVQTAPTPPEQSKNKFGLFSTAIGTSLGGAMVYSVGAAVRHHPVHKGAIIALTGGAVVGAVVGLIGASLGIKQKGNSLQLTFCSFLLEWAACLGTMPLGAEIVPFKQNLATSTLIEDQLIGSVIISSPALGLLILLSCCLIACYSQLPAEERMAARSHLMDTLRNYFCTVDLILAIEEANIIEETPIVVEANLQTANSSTTDTMVNVPSDVMAYRV